MQQIRWLIVSFVFSFWFIPSGLSQSEFTYKSFGKQSGLKTNSCRDMVRDGDGFTWIATDRGLYRFDGNSFFSFTHIERDTTTIANNRCNGLLLDSKGQLWVNTEDGLSVYHSHEQTFSNYVVDTDVLPNNGYAYTEMSEDSDNRIWIGGNHDLLIFDPATKKFITSGWIHFAKQAGIVKRELRNSISQSVRKKSKDELWILTVYGLFSVNTKTMQFEYHQNPLIDDFFSFKISCIDPKGVLWISTYDRCFFSYDPNKKLWTHYDCPENKNSIPNYIADILLDGDDLIVVNGQQIVKYLKDTKKYIPYSKAHSLSTVIQNNEMIYSVFPIKDDIFLYTSGKNPLVHIKYVESNIKKKTLALPKKHTNNTAAFLHYKDETLIGDWHYGYIFCCTHSTCTLLQDQFRNTNLGLLQQYFSLDQVMSYMSTSKNIYVYNEQISSVKKLAVPTDFVKNENTEFRNFVADKNNIVYVRERNSGIYTMDIKNLKIQHLDVDLPYENYSALGYDPIQHRLWISIDNMGLFEYDIQLNKSIKYTGNKLFSSKNLFVNDIQSDKKGNMYILLKGKGILQINTKTNSSTHFTTEDGLISNEVKYGLLDNSGNLWFTSDMGLMVYQAEYNSFKSFESEPEAELLTDRIFWNNKGNICQNLYPNTYIEVNNLIINKDVAKGHIYLKNMQNLEKPFPIDSVFTLAYHQNTLTLQFGYLNNENLYLPQIEYSINESYWKLLPDNQTISLLNLPSGVYDISVRDSKSPAISKNIKIIIETPWWNSWPFYTLLGASLLCLGIWAYRYRVRKIRLEETEKNTLKQRIAKTEMAALRAQMNPHFIFNSLNSINRFILVNDTEAASDYLTKFSRLIRIILDSSKEELISLDKELDALKLYIGIEAMRFNDSFQWEIRVDSNVMINQLMVPPLLLQPYVENAIWHGLMQSPDHFEKKLHIHIFGDNDRATIIEISDTGIGRQNADALKSKSANNRKSHGMLLTEERLRLMYETVNIKGVLKIEDKFENSIDQKGTKVTLKIYSNESHISR